MIACAANGATHTTKVLPVVRVTYRRLFRRLDRQCRRNDVSSSSSSMIAIEIVIFEMLFLSFKNATTSK